MLVICLVRSDQAMWKLAAVISKSFKRNKYHCRKEGCPCKPLSSGAQSVVWVLQRVSRVGWSPFSSVSAEDFFLKFQMSFFRFQLILLGLIKSMYFYCSWEVLISPLSCVWAHLDLSTAFFFYSFLFSFISPSVFQVLVLISYESLTPTICNANVFNLIVLGCDRVPATLFLVSLSVKRTPTLKVYFLIVIMERIDLLIWNGHTLGLEWAWN